MNTGLYKWKFNLEVETNEKKIIKNKQKLNSEMSSAVDDEILFKHDEDKK